MIADFSKLIISSRFRGGKDMNVDGILSVILQRTSEGLPPLKSRGPDWVCCPFVDAWIFLRK